MTHTIDIIDITDRYRVEIRIISDIDLEWLPVGGLTDFTATEADLAMFHAVRSDCKNNRPDMFEYRKVAQ